MLLSLSTFVGLLFLFSCFEKNFLRQKKKGYSHSGNENETLTFRICITINDFRIDVISDVFRIHL